MHWSSPADDGPTLTARELRAFEQIAAELRRDAQLEPYLGPRRRHISLDHATALLQTVVAGFGVALMAIGLTSHVLIAAPGFLALVAATTGLTSRVSLRTFGLGPVTDEPTDGDRSLEPGH